MRFSFAIRSSSPLAFALVLVLVAAAPSAAQIEAKKELQKLEKDLGKCNKRIEREEKKLAKRKTECSAEYAKLHTDEAQAELARLLDAVRTKHAEAIGDGSKVKRSLRNQVRKDIRASITTSVGRNIAIALARPLTDEFIVRVNAADYASATVIKTTIEDLFTGKFEADFDSEIKVRLSSKMKDLADARTKIKGEIATIEAKIRASQSGLPFGMVRIEGGEYEIGLDRKDIERFAKTIKEPMRKVILSFRSSPAHKRKLDPFFIDINEVTTEAYHTFLKDTGHKGYPESANAYPKHFAMNKKFLDDWNKRPIAGIAHDDAVAFCRWVGRRLPTEFEWEIAARFGSNKRKKRINFWSWGDTPPVDKGVLRCNYAALFEHPLRPPYIKGVKVIPPVMPVGSFPDGRNELSSLNDTCGNAAEFTSSPFLAYPGFKRVSIDKRTADQSDFHADKVVVRGGHGNNGVHIVTTFWRIGVGRSGRVALAGFRTAATPIKGKDHFDYVFEDGAINRFLVDYPPLNSDINDGRENAVLDFADPQRFTALMAGGWNVETGLPERARYISVMNRKAVDFRNAKTLNELADGKPMLIGFMHLDVACAEPKLEPGDYLLLWHPAHEEEIEESAEGGSAPEDGDADKKDKGSKKGKSDKKAKQEKKTKSVPDRVLFYNIKKSKDDIVPLNMETNPPVVSTAQPTAIRQLSKQDGNGVTISLAFPIKYKRKNSLVISIPLKTAAGVTKDFK